MKRLVVTVFAVALAVSGCGSDDGGASEHRTLTVLAASSLTGTFTDLAEQFESAHPGVQVKLVFDSSATLAQQAIEQAPGDVLATADQRTMDEAKANGGIQDEGDVVEFATNLLVLAVPKDNPADIDDIGDLNRDGIDFLTCVRTAPCGAAASTLLKKDGITRKPVSEEVDVKAVETKLAAGEADAGLVYHTDVVASGGKLTGIAVRGSTDVPNTYWVAVTARAGADTVAAQWVTFVSGEAGRMVLLSAGFGVP
jgi:molybdate transport system substrate-binding protein